MDNSLKRLIKRDGNKKNTNRLEYLIQAKEM